nr:DDE-type integrase/transposase/recombinase [Candidatus Sigynarchaeota archaeon]
MMAEAVALQLAVGKGEHQTLLALPCLCPNCCSDDYKCNGHDTSVIGDPQYYTCHKCGRTFYVHTSFYVKHFADELRRYIGDCLKKGHLNNQRLKVALKATDSTTSNVMARIVKLINTSPRAEFFWNEPVKGLALFIDETFITINQKTWYLIVIINEEGRVLHFDVVEHRTSEVISSMLDTISLRLQEPFTHLITDAFPAYKNVAKKIGRDIIHVQHIHKPPYGRIIIDQIHHEPEKIITTTYATTNDILVKTNAFLVQESTTEEKKVKGKRGRPKGSKNKPKNAMKKKDP